MYVLYKLHRWTVYQRLSPIKDKLQSYYQFLCIFGTENAMNVI